MSKKLAEEIFDEIKLKNTEKGMTSIPHSDELLAHFTPNLGIETELAKELIRVLINSHKIFAIEIVAEDLKKNIPNIQAYVETDIHTIKRLNNYFQDELIRMYENEYYKRISYHKIMKEIFPTIKNLNNTPFGQVANKAFMLGELDNLLEKNYNEYTDEWKERHFEIELDKANLGDKSKEKTEAYAEGEEAEFTDRSKKKDRAVDSKKYNDFLSKSKNYPLDRIIKIYGINFFLRVHIRKYEFSYLANILDKSDILTKSELMILKNMIHQVKMNSDKDPELENHRDSIYGLERALTHRLHFKN
ncbi:MAG: hypothetical protein GY870_06945 [archaeon]|nr:hypothetical protein [archaeon]